MIATRALHAETRRVQRVSWSRARGVALLSMAAVLAGMVGGYLVSLGMWYLVVGLVLAIPAFVAFHRYPLASVLVWLLVAPFVTITNRSSFRLVYWLVHRALPPATIFVVLFGTVLGLRSRRLPRLGWPEILMGGYVVATFCSITYTSGEPRASAYTMYDRVVVPMCLYLLVRLVEPKERDIRRFVPIVAFVLVTQSVVGLIAWSAPALLPSEWLTKLGERTTGSLGAPEVFGATVLFCGAIVLHYGLTAARTSLARLLSVSAFVLSMAMVFMSFSRSVWLSGIAVTAGLLVVHRAYLRQLFTVLVLAGVVLFASGMLSQQYAYAQERLHSEQAEESALSRLPVMLAAVRMFEAKPLTGFGYENFDRFDRSFQGRVGNLADAEKDHASHNLYLTTLAEQGVVGFTLFLGPLILWGMRTLTKWKYLPRTGLIDRRFVVVLWLAMAAQILVSNFYRFQNGFALGMWWLILGLIASVVGRHRPTEPLRAVVP